MVPFKDNFSLIQMVFIVGIRVPLKKAAKLSSKCKLRKTVVGNFLYLYVVQRDFIHYNDLLDHKKKVQKGTGKLWNETLFGIYNLPDEDSSSEESSSDEEDQSWEIAQSEAEYMEQKRKKEEPDWDELDRRQGTILAHARTDFVPVKKSSSAISVPQVPFTMKTIVPNAGTKIYTGNREPNDEPGTKLNFSEKKFNPVESVTEEPPERGFNPVKDAPEDMEPTMKFNMCEKREPPSTEESGQQLYEKMRSKLNL